MAYKTKRLYKLKDKKIIIWKPTLAEDSIGNTINIYLPYAKVWAHYRQTSGNEYYLIRGVLDAQIDAMFTINYRDDLKESFYISYGDKVFNISRIDDYEGYKQDLEISATWKNQETVADLIKSAAKKGYTIDLDSL